MSIFDDLALLRMKESTEEYLLFVNQQVNGVGFNQYSTQPNIFGGWDIHGETNHGIQAIPNVFGGYNINEF